MQDCYQKTHKVFADKSPFRRSIVGSDSQAQLTEEQRRDRQRSIQLHMQLLQHASGCRNQQCPSANCNKMKVSICAVVCMNCQLLHRRIFLNTAQHVLREFRVGALFVVAFGRYCRSTHASVGETRAWFPSVDN